MEFILLGDNINFSLSGIYNNSKRSKLIQDFWLHQYIKTPSRITKNSESIFDHIYSTSPQFISETIIPETGISNHYPIAFTYNCNSSFKNSKANQTINKRSLSKLKMSSCLNDLSCINFDVLEIIVNPDDALKYFL